MTTTPAAIEQGLQTIPLAAISPNPQNPRKHFDQAALKDLAESIKSHGVRQPVLLRPTSKGYQLVCGERRFRASKLAGKTDIPAIVDSTLTDRQALEIGILENLQREGVHPLDEALGYDALLKMNDKGEKETVEGIAAKVGKSKEYVYARLKLTALIPAGREAFQGDRISAGHAVLIARLQPLDQVKALAACLTSYHDLKAFKDHDPLNITLKMIANEDHPLIPEKALREWIQDNVNLKLKDVPWDLADANILPGAGTCTDCPKRSGSNPALFSELTIKGEDTCFDAECFKNKRDAFVGIELLKQKQQSRAFEKGDIEAFEELRQISEQAGYTTPGPDQKVLKQGQWLPAKKGECANVETGLIVRGENAGTKQLICCNGACKVHKHNLGARGSESRGKTVDYEFERYKRHKQETKGKKAAASRAQLIRQMVGHVSTKIPAEILREVVLRLADGCADGPDMLWLIGLDPKAAKEANFEKAVGKAKDIQLNQFLVAATLLRSMNENLDDEEERAELLTFSKALGLKTAPAILAAQDKRLAELKACRGCGCTEETACVYWENGKRKSCSWVEDDLCSNPECKKYAPPAKGEASAKKAKGKK